MKIHFQNSFSVFGLLFVSVFALLSIQSCCQDKEPNLPGRQCKSAPFSEYYFYLDSVRDYLYFKPGTWWVYKNTKTNELDTIELLNSSLDTVILRGHYDYSINRMIHLETISWSTWSRTNKIQYDYIDPGIFVDMQPLKRILRINQFKTSTKDYYTNITNFISPLEKGTLDGNGASTTTLFTADTTCIIESETYIHTKIFEIKLDGSWFPPSQAKHIDSRYYWSKNIGLIKRENLSDNYAWILVDKYIKQ